MGKSLPHPTKLKTFVNFIGSDSFPRHRAAQAKPGYKPRPLLPSGEPKVKGQIRVIESSSSERRLGRYKMEESAVSTSSSEHRRVPLADVVTDCIRRWFQDTLKEAKAGDISMQVLVGQMYFSGYGVPVDAEKGRAWISRASRTRSSAWKVSDKRPGYNLSDSDSDDNAGDVK